MKQILRAILVSSLFASSAALAQEMDMDMNIQVDDDGMPSTDINIQVPDEDGNMQGVRMRTRASDGNTGGNIRMEVKVKGNPGPAMREDEPAPTRHRDHEEERHVRRREPRPAPGFRDCGIPRDPGCTMMRDGQYPMDAEVFKGFMQSLKAQHNEISREEMAQKMLKRHYLTAAQYGQVLDLFANEITKLDVAKFAAPHVVNPQHALGFSSKWHNSISGEEYTEMIAEQQP